MIKKTKKLIEIFLDEFNSLSCSFLNLKIKAKTAMSHFLIVNFMYEESLHFEPMKHEYMT